MQRDYQGIVAGADLDRAFCQQTFGVVAGQHQFTQPLRRDEEEDEGRDAHAACRSETQLAVKPGPSAVTSERGGRPCASARSSTNRTVGADMLP